MLTDTEGVLGTRNDCLSLAEGVASGSSKWASSSTFFQRGDIITSRLTACSKSGWLGQGELNVSGGNGVVGGVSLTMRCCGGTRTRSIGSTVLSVVEKGNFTSSTRSVDGVPESVASVPRGCVTLTVELDVEPSSSSPGNVWRAGVANAFVASSSNLGRFCEGMLFCFRVNGAPVANVELVQPILPHTGGGGEKKSVQVEEGKKNLFIFFHSKQGYVLVGFQGSHRPSVRKLASECTRDLQ